MLSATFTPPIPGITRLEAFLPDFLESALISSSLRQISVNVPNYYRLIRPLYPPGIRSSSVIRRRVIHGHDQNIPPIVCVPFSANNQRRRTTVSTVPFSAVSGTDLTSAKPRVVGLSKREKVVCGRGRQTPALAEAGNRGR